MQTKDDDNNVKLLEETACAGSESACNCRLAMQKIDSLEASLGDIKNVSFHEINDYILRLRQSQCLGIFYDICKSGRKSRRWKMHFKTPRR